MNQEKLDPNQLREKFELFVFELSDSLMALNTHVKSFERPDLLPLDYSTESLNRLEEAYKLVLNEDILVVDKDIFTTRVGRYLGETLRRKVGGHWNMCSDPNNVCYGLPWITNIPKLPDFGWCPSSVVFNYRAHRRHGLLHKAIDKILKVVVN